MIDSRAFVSQSSVIGVFGEGFDNIKVKTKKRYQIPEDVLDDESAPRS